MCVICPYIFIYFYPRKINVFRGICAKSNNTWGHKILLYGATSEPIWLKIIWNAGKNPCFPRQSSVTRMHGPRSNVNLSSIKRVYLFTYNPQSQWTPPNTPTYITRHMLTGRSLSDIKVATAKNIACINCNVIISVPLEYYYTR